MLGCHGGKYWEELKQYLHLRWNVGSVLRTAEHDGCSAGTGHRRTVNSALSCYQLITAHRYLLQLKWAPRQQYVLWSADECSQSDQAFLCLPSGCDLPVPVHPRNFNWTHRNGFTSQLTLTLLPSVRQLDCWGFRPKLLRWRRNKNKMCFHALQVRFVTGKSWTGPLLQLIPLSFSEADVKNIRGIDETFIWHGKLDISNCF